MQVRLKCLQPQSLEINCTKHSMSLSKQPNQRNYNNHFKLTVQTVLSLYPANHNSIKLVSL